MSYETRLPPPARRDFRQFVFSHFEKEKARLEAARRLTVLLERIGSDPLEMGSTAPGPIPGLVSVREITVGDLKYPVRVAYEFSEDEEAIVITEISFQAM